MPDGRDRTRQSAGRARLALWLGVLALLVQALLPAAALAAQSRSPGGEQMAICTSVGVRTVAVDPSEDAKTPFAGLPCQDCLAAAVAALPAPDPAAEPVAYARARIDHGPERSWAPQLARAPPRPPGQGPPQA